MRPSVLDLVQQYKVTFFRIMPGRKRSYSGLAAYRNLFSGSTLTSAKRRKVISALARAGRRIRRNRYVAYYRNFNPRAPPTAVITHRQAGIALPESINVRMPYSFYEGNYIASGATQVSVIFRGQSVFDPDYVNVGHQPFGMDQYTAQYDYYKVLDVAISMDIVVTGGTAAGAPYGPQCGLIVGICALPTATAQTIQWYLENTSAKHQTCVSTTTMHLGAKFNAMTVLGQNPNTDEQLQAAVTTNPAVDYYIHVWKYANGTDALLTCSYIHNCKAVYNTTFFRPKTLGIS